MDLTEQSKIRNFCIVAHIDHGKSTLADRIIEHTGLLTSREMQNQVLDNMELERERGITIKAQSVRTVYRAKDGEEYIFNLIDTPGHVDFNYEVSRSLAACDGAILVVDAAQGIEAQTLANVYLALDHDLDVFPVINKIDLPSAEPQRVIEEIEDVIGIEAQDAPLISAKNGIGIEDVLEQVVKKIPAPKGDPDAPLKALIFDSVYDSYKGVIIFCRIMEGTVKRGTTIRMMATGAREEVVEVGYFGAGQFIPCEELSAGMVGYITASIKNVKDTAVGDTVTDANNPCAEALPGYKKVLSMVYCGMYPADGAKYPDLRDALEKLQLNDASLNYEPETSMALGFGFRCGFLGLLHLEIIQERLEREYNLDLVTTAPGVVYKVFKTNGGVIELTNPSNLPDPSEIEHTPHLHIDFVPFTTGSKRGLDTRVSLKQALAAQGFKGGTRGDTEWSQWVRSEKEQLAAVMERHGIEWEDKGTHDKHLPVLDFKKEQRAKEIAELEAAKAKKQGQVEQQERRLKELAPAVRNMEQLAAQFSDDPERILPEPGPLESAKSYREKKAKPLLAQIVKVLRSLYRAYVELKGRYERLQGDYGRAREGNERLSDRLQEVKLENKALRGTVADFERVKRAFGPEEVERAVEDARRREAAEKEKRKAKRKFSRGAR